MEQSSPKPLSRRLRFEILRRDEHTCRYCGESAPDVKLTVDHVLPVSLGGTNDPTNLVTACRDCNAGKASTSPDEKVVDDVDARALLWGQAMKRAADVLRQRDSESADYVSSVDDAWTQYQWRGGDLPRPKSWPHTVRSWHSAGLPVEVVLDAVDIAMDSQARIPDVWRYFCGICWRRLTEQQDAARDLMEGGE